MPFIPVATKGLAALELPDCIYLSERCRCAILQVPSCRGEKCPFRQNVEEQSRAREQWRKALDALSPDAQGKIAGSYYGGFMPWKE